MDEVAANHSNIAGSKTITITTATKQPTGSAKNGKRKETEHNEERKRKCFKVDEGPSVKIKVPKPKPQKQLKDAYSKERSTASIGFIWKPIKMGTPPGTTQSQKQPSLTELKPRIWISSREELVALLPDLAGPKCLNGVSWLMYETPMVLLDESTACFDISLQEDTVTLDLLTTREFTCTWPPPRFERALDPPEILTVDDVRAGMRSNLGPSAEKVPKTRRTEKSTHTAVTAPATGSTNPTQISPEAFDACPPFTEDTKPVIFESSTRAAAIAMDDGSHPQLSSANITFSAGPALQMQNTSSSGMKLVPMSAAPNKHIAVTNNRFKSSINKLHPSEVSQPTSLTSKCYNPSKQIPTLQTSSYKVVKAPESQAHTGSENAGPSQLERSTGQPTIHIDHQVDSEPKSELQATETVGPTNYASDEARIEQVRDAKAFQDAFIPSTIPEEIQAIIDSYLSGRPVLLVISNKRFFDHWSLRLQEEFGFSMLGYFRILGVQESRVDLNDPVRPLKDSSGSMTGRVKWLFRLQWSAGGEEWILPNHDKHLLEYPWWKPPPPLSILPLEAQIPSLDADNPGLFQDISAEPFAPSMVSNFDFQSKSDKDPAAPFEPENNFDTTPRYRVARLSNVNYEVRHAHLRELYHSHVPLQLLAPYGCKVLDSSFPWGWLCKTCGKMNFQAALRHRACSSSFCKTQKPEIAPYAIELIFMRDPQDNLSMVLPYNEPLLINLVDTWEDGMRTLPYYIHDDENIFIKHIFSRNLPALQVEATRLLHLIQIEVELVRPIGENTPYFQYSAHAPKGDPSPTTSEWPNVPLCIHHAKDWTQHQAIWFGELKKEQLSINHLCLLAWVTSGTKRGPAIIRAKEKCVVFHAFGCNIVVLVTPLSPKTTPPEKVGGVDFDSLIPMEGLPPDEPDVHPGWISEDDDAVEDPSQEEKERLPATPLKKASNPNRPFLFTLVHGDILVFYGDDFEYSLKRGGTSFLLIASHQHEP